MLCYLMSQKIQVNNSEHAVNCYALPKFPALLSLYADEMDTSFTLGNSISSGDQHS
jgi:hypothetical protein